MKIFSLKVLFVVFLLNGHSFSQGIPSFKQGVVYLSKFIASDYFASLKKHSTDTELVDTLYLRSVKFYNNDLSESMLALTFACLPYKEMHLKIPVIQIMWTIPLPAVPSPLFDRKTKNLPSKLFADSPDNDFGDKDKLPHFFGTAFIEYNFSFFNISKFLGIFVEKFEETFYVQGAMDKRDLLIDRLGAKFGKGLKNNRNLLPSELFNNYSSKRK